VAAKKRAREACVYLGASIGTLGSAAFGKCYLQALRAFDCKVDPARAPLGKKYALYKCLGAAKTKAAANTCVFGATVPRPCGLNATSTECGENSVVAQPANPRPRETERYRCVDVRVNGETCLLTGRRCRYNGAGVSYCGGTGEIDCATGCDGSNLQYCIGGNSSDNGRDCALEGDGNCGVSGSTFDCRPSDLGLGACTTGALACDGDVVEKCIGARRVRVDCGRFGYTCRLPTTGLPPATLEEYCAPPVSGTCTESCSGTTLQSCLLGGSITVDCTTVPGMTRCVPGPSGDGAHCE
jgi:hypothetical protein